MTWHRIQVNVYRQLPYTITAQPLFSNRCQLHQRSIRTAVTQFIHSHMNAFREDHKCRAVIERINEAFNIVEFRNVVCGHPVEIVFNAFLEFFVQQGQSDAVVLSIRQTVNRIITLSASYRWDTYQDIKDWYSGNGLTKKYLSKIHRIIDQMEYWQSNSTLVGWDDQGVVNVRKRRFLTISIDKMTAVPSLGDLDLSYVQHHIDEFLDCVKGKGYSDSFVEATRNDLKRIIMLSRSMRWDTIGEISEWNEQRPISDSHKSTTRSTLEKLSCWLATGDVPDHPSVQKKLESRIKSIGKLDLSFWQDHLDELLEYMKEII